MQNYDLDHLLRQFNLAYRLGNQPGLRSAIPKFDKFTREQDCAPIVRTRFYLEIAKGLRALDQPARAIGYCDLGIANIPPSAESPKLLSALKRVRVLLYLDDRDYRSAESLLAEVDGLELSLAENQTIVSRNDSDITAETWLLSCEVALAKSEIETAQRCLDRSIDTLAASEKAFYARSAPPAEIRQKQAESADLRQMMVVYAGIIRLVVGDESGGRATLAEAKQSVIEKNEAALRGESKNTLPNVPLLSKITCLLGEWSPDDQHPPRGINRREAERFFSLGLGKPLAGKTAIVPVESNQLISHQPAATDEALISNAALSGDRTERVLELVAEVLNRLENNMKTAVAVPAPATNAAVNTRSLFSGNLNYFDIDAMLFNAKQGELTGYIRFRWNPAYYESQQVVGKLPASISKGEAYLFFVGGVVTDATIGNPAASASTAEAEENFRLIVQLCLSIGLDVQPDIIGEAYAASLADRPALLSIVQDDFIHYLTDVENRVGGFHPNEMTDENFDLAFAAPSPAAALPEAAPIILENNSYTESLATRDQPEDEDLLSMLL